MQPNTSTIENNHYSVARQLAFTKSKESFLLRPGSNNNKIKRNETFGHSLYFLSVVEKEGFDYNFLSFHH
jgi:hypothetical protein